MSLPRVRGRRAPGSPGRAGSARTSPTLKPRPEVAENARSRPEPRAPVIARSPSNRPQPRHAHPVVVDSLRRYWRTNIRILLLLLGVWATVSLGCGVLLADVLNQYRLGGCPLGFWFAQQGSILAFVTLILVYALLLNRLDRRHHREITEIRENGGRGSIIIRA